jgi:cytochrome d ubiquinol oxidase subunit I
VAATQPAKLAAMDGHFETGQGGSPLYVVGLPDEKEQRVKYALAVPGLLSFLVHGDAHEPVKGLDQVPRQDWPPVALTFHAFHLMVGLGFLFILLTGLGCYFRWRGTLFEKRWLMAIFVGAVPLPYLANQLGWVTAEVGRQPWIVYGLLRTSDGLSEAVSRGQTLGSMLMFLLIYGLLFAVWLHVLNDKIQRGPEPMQAPPTTTGRGLAEVSGLRTGTGGASLTRPGDAGEA